MIIDYNGVAKKIEEFVSDGLPKQSKSIEASANLFELENFDSLKIVTMVTFIEKDFGITLDYEDLTEDNLRSIDSITKLILRKKST